MASSEEGPVAAFPSPAELWARTFAQEMAGAIASPPFPLPTKVLTGRSTSMQPLPAVLFRLLPALIALCCIHWKAKLGPDDCQRIH